MREVNIKAERKRAKGIGGVEKEWNGMEWNGKERKKGKDAGILLGIRHASGYALFGKILASFSSGIGFVRRLTTT